MRLNPDHAECRLLHRHAWRRTQHFEIDGATMLASYRCTRCTTRLHLGWNVWTGEVEAGPSYGYAEGYLAKGKKLVRSEARRLAVRALVREIKGRRAA